MDALKSEFGPEEKIVKTACQMCSWSCGINVHVKNGRMVKVTGMTEHPLNRGKICVKSPHCIDQAYAPDRLMYPLRKVKSEFRRISWEEALELIVQNLRRTKETYGPTGFAALSGDVVLLQEQVGGGLIARFCDVYGSPNHWGPVTCYYPRIQARIATFGNFLQDDLENARCVVLWGHNPSQSHSPNLIRLSEAMRRGAKLIVIDPKRTRHAEKADVHVQLRPGTDCALALGMLHTIITENLYDLEFVEKWTIGFDKLKEHVQQYAPEKIKDIVGVPAETVREAARIYAITKPASIVEGISHLCQQATGFQISRGIALLQAITGNVGIRGGFVRVSGSRLQSLRLADQMWNLKPLQADRYPVMFSLWNRILGEGQNVQFAETILTGEPYPIKMMIVTGANPVVTYPNAARVTQALDSLDFLVVTDLVMTPTARLADLVLPAATFLERIGIFNQYFFHNREPYLMLRKQVVPPPEECWPDWKFWLELAKRMGYEEHFPWNNAEEILDYCLKPTGLTVKFLTEEKPSGITAGEVKYGEHEEKGFWTPSGKIELYSETLKNLGYDPLPNYDEQKLPRITKEYPLILITGARMLEYWHTESRNVQTLRKRAPEPLAELNPKTAKEFKVGDGEIIFVETSAGSLQIKARVTEDIREGVVSIPHGWDSANVNLLTDNQFADPVSGCSVTQGIPCRVRRKTI